MTRAHLAKCRNLNFFVTMIEAKVQNLHLTNFGDYNLYCNLDVNVYASLVGEEVETQD
jgi:hypothetical protein